MPRSKNPNPRQVMDGEEGDNAMDCGDPVDNEMPEGDSPCAMPAVMNGQGDEDQCLDMREGESPVETITTKREMRDSDSLADRSLTPEVGLAFANSEIMKSESPVELPPSPSSFFSRLSPSLAKLTQSSITPARGNESRKAKNGTSPGIFNPSVMTWMRNRFQIRPGGRISASDVIALYRSDTQHLEDPPPGLQNYQVGQLLRRIFPMLSRCKITVEGKRHWIYKDLNLVENPPEDLFQERNSPPPLLEFEENGFPTGQTQDRHLRGSDSPASNIEEGGLDVDDANNHGSPDPGNGDDEENREKSNAILLGLLSKKTKSAPSSTNPVDMNEGDNETELPKKKRDSEVIEWLRENYKFKPGYYVKSMDLLRKYNSGRMEMVKYLSQVGRVMKHVFPSVRHLRKSFKGGKREWVYLNIKPIDVDSDSEEGRSMLMPVMRRSPGWYGAGSSDLFQSPASSSLPGWKRERVKVSHTPLSLVHRSPVFKPKSSTFHPLSYSDKVVRSTAFRSLIKHEPQGSPVGEPASKTRIVLYNKKDMDKPEVEPRMPSEIEKDIFAPFVKLNHHVKDQGMEAGASNFITSESNPVLNIRHLAVNRCEDDAAENKNGVCSSKEPLIMKIIHRSDKIAKCVSVKPNCDHQSGNEETGLDLSVKRKQPEVNSENEEGASYSFGHGEDPELSDNTKALNLIKSPIKENSVSSPPSLPVKTEPCTSQTIHYHPSKGGTGTENGFKSTEKSKPPRNGLKLGEIIEKTLLPQITSVCSDSSQQYLEMNTRQDDAPVSWQSLQTFNAQRYGWIRSLNNSLPKPENNGRKAARFVEWFMFSGQWLINKHRAFREIKIYEDWTVVIHALGRRVYPNDLGGITDLEKTSASLNKVFRVLAEAKMCMGFPAPSVSDLYIHGILVSKFEVWSSREDTGEDIRQRAVNCQILYSGPNACCSKCARIMKLHQQQKRGVTSGKRLSVDNLPGFHAKQPKL